MRCATAAILLTLSVTLCWIAHSVDASGPPTKPAGGFRSESEIANYLRDLRRYWAHNGAPRFGKRSDTMRPSLDDNLLEDYLLWNRPYTSSANRYRFKNLYDAEMRR